MNTTLPHRATHYKNTITSHYLIPGNSAPHHAMPSNSKHHNSPHATTSTLEPSHRRPHYTTPRHSQASPRHHTHALLSQATLHQSTLLWTTRTVSLFRRMDWRARVGRGGTRGDARLLWVKSDMNYGRDSSLVSRPLTFSLLSRPIYIFCSGSPPYFSILSLLFHSLLVFPFCLLFVVGA